MFNKFCMINDLWFWIIIGTIVMFLFIWLFVSIYRGIKHEMLQILGYLLLIAGLSLSIGSYPAPAYFDIIGGILGYIALIISFFSVLMANRRWVIRRGIKNLNKFRNLMIFAYARHPLTLAMIIVSLAVFMINNSVLSNVLCVMAGMCFILSSIEKDLFYEQQYGYPYKFYCSKVPRFNLILGFIRSFKTEKEESTG